jgi:hypothetical protein
MITSKPPPDSRNTLIQLCCEYLFKGMVVLTSCIIVLLAVAAYVGWLKTERNVDIKDLVIIAGIGFSAASGSYFRPIRGARRNANGG